MSWRAVWADPAVWYAVAPLLLLALGVAMWRQRPLRPTAALLAGMLVPVAGLVLTALTVLKDPVAIPRNLAIACAVFLVVGRGRPLDVVPVDYVHGWRDEAHRQRHRARAARRERELMVAGGLLVAGVVAWGVAVLT